MSWHAYLISAALGLIVGIEREKSASSTRTMGVRTFLLIAILGALTGDVHEPLLQVVLAFGTLALVVTSYAKGRAKVRTAAPSPLRSEHDLGLTTEFAAIVVFVLAYLSHQLPTLAVLFAPILALLLFSKKALHHFTDRLKASELQAALLILLIGVTVVTLVPDKAIDPWGILNPKKFGFLILILAGLEFAGYVLAKIVGDHRSQLLMGFLGGMVSSTVVTLATARSYAQRQVSLRAGLVTVVAAIMASLIQLLVIVAVVSMDLAVKLALPVLICEGLGAIFLWIASRRLVEKTRQAEMRSPLDLWGVFRLAILMILILGFVAEVQVLLGDEATRLTAFLAGLFELHGVSLATATLVVQGKLSLALAEEALLLAIAASLIAKSGLAWIVQRSRFAALLSAIASVVLLVLGGVYVLA